MGRLKFAIDANESPVLVQLWSKLFPTHDFTHVNDIGLKAATDLELFAQLSEWEYDALITRDKNQLHVPQELEGLRASGLSWIGHREASGRGLEGIRPVLAAYALALPHVVTALEDAGEPLQFTIKKVPGGASQRLKARRLSDASPFPLPR